jgi:hypothetical protein
VAVPDVELRVHAWLSRRPAPWWVLLLKGPEVSGSGASLGRARRDLASSACEWANRVLSGTGASATDSAEYAQLARLVVEMEDAGTLVDALMPRPEAVFRAEGLRRAA